MNISYNPSEDRFNITSNGISIKKYPSDVTSYLYGKNTDLLVGSGLRAPFIKENVTTTDDTSYPYIRVGGILKYHKNNFKNLRYGTIRFSVKKAICTNDYAYFNLINYQGGIEQGTYTLKYSHTTNGNQDVVETLNIVVTKNNANINDIVGYIQSAIETKFISPRPIKAERIANGIMIRTLFDSGVATTGRIKCVEGTLLEYFSLENDLIFSAPDNDTVIFGLKDDNDNNNQILFIHKTDGNLYLIMSNEDGTYTLTKKVCSWNWTNEEFTEFELNFDSDVFNVLVNGKFAIKPSDTVGFAEGSTTDLENIVRSELTNTHLVLVGKYNNIQGDTYDYNKIVIYNTKQHCGTYTPLNNEFQYNGDGYVIYNYGQLSAFDDKKLTIEGEGAFNFQMLDGSSLMVESNSIADFKQKVEALDYDTTSTLSFETASDLIFKVQFIGEGAILNKFSFDKGTVVYDDNDPYNFEDIYDWVRRECGAPQVVCELTNEQIYDALSEAVESYNKYRNYDKNISIESLDGSSETDLKRGYSKKEGTYFILPPGISDKDVIDIFFHPRYSCAWFGAGNDFINNVMAQTFFSRAADMSTTAADYYIYRSSLNDISNILGTQISWRIYNNHLHITPNNMEWLDQVSIGIVYKQPLTVEEIRNSWQIKRYCLGRSMMILGMIRGTFASGVPAGDMTVQFNSETLLSRGKELIDEALTSMKKEQYPLFMIWN